MPKLKEFSAIGHRLSGFNMYRDIAERDIEVGKPFEFVEVENTDMNKSLFDLVFSVNPITKLPVGDIAMLLGDQVNPDIKRFIELNLMNPNGLDSDSAGEFSALDDDTIADFMRNPNESLGEYRDRMFQVLRDEHTKSVASN